MTSLGILFILGSSLVTSLRAAGQDQKAGVSTPRQSGDEDYYQKDWGNDKAVYDLSFGDSGDFAVSWDEPNGGNFVVGVGYETGRNIKFNYSGIFEPGDDSNAYLALYGWTYNPMVEYYVMENFGVHHPADNPNSTCFGHFESDGGTYEVWRKYQTGSIVFPQYWAVRTTRRVGGTITTRNFFRAWEAAGLPLGDKGEMVMAIEGQWGNGDATITVGAPPSTSVKETATPTTRTNVATRKHTCTAIIDI